MVALAADQLVDGKYRIVRFVGQGAWASVYEGINVRIQRRVAIKVLGEETLNKPGVVERFEREAQAATRIESEHVVSVFDLGMLADGRPYMVMELLEGEDLGQHLARRGILSEEKATYFAVQALSGLADAHASGVLHRDIKPDNVVLVKSKQGDEIVKIVDFGISKLHSGMPQVTSITQTNAVLGSPVYMSPEQCRGARMMDHRSDLYSLGVVLFEALTGQLPHMADTFNALMFKIALEDAPDPRSHKADLDPELAKIVSKALSREPAARFQSALEFQQALITWAESKGYEPSSWPGAATRRRVRIHEDVHLTKTTQRPSMLDSSESQSVVAALSASGTVPTGARQTGNADDGNPTPPLATTVTTHPRPFSRKAIVGAAAAVLLLAAAGFALFRQSPPAQAAATTTPPPSATPVAMPVAPTTTAAPTSVNGAEAPTVAAATTATATATATTVTPVLAAPRPPVGKFAAPTTTPASAAASAPATPASAAPKKTVVDGRTIQTNF